MNTPTKTYSTLYSTYEIWMYCYVYELDICNLSEEEAILLKLIFPDIDLTLNENKHEQNQPL